MRLDDLINCLLPADTVIGSSTLLSHRCFWPSADLLQGAVSRQTLQKSGCDADPAHYITDMTDCRTSCSMCIDDT